MWSNELSYPALLALPGNRICGQGSEALFLAENITVERWI